MIRLTKVESRWEERPDHWFNFFPIYDHNWVNPYTQPILIDPEEIRSVEPMIPMDKNGKKAKGGPFSTVHLKNGDKFDVDGHYVEIAKLAHLQWTCQFCGSGDDECKYCGAPRDEVSILGG